MKKNDVTRFLKEHTGTILTVSSCICTAATAYFGIQAGLKLSEIDTDDKKEIAKTCLPVGIACASAIGLSVAADISHCRKLTSLANTCLLSGIGYMNYREEVIKRYGEEVDADIIATTIADNCAFHCTTYDVADTKCHWIFDPCMDGIPCVSFDAYERDVIHAEYHFNRNYILRFGASINDLIEMYTGGRLDNEDADIYGWIPDDNEVYFVDIEHHMIEGCTVPTFRITPVFIPWNIDED